MVTHTCDSNAEVGRSSVFEARPACTVILSSARSTEQDLVSKQADRKHREGKRPVTVAESAVPLGGHGLPGQSVSAGAECVCGTLGTVNWGGSRENRGQ